MIFFSFKEDIYIQAKQEKRNVFKFTLSHNQSSVS